MGLGYSLAQWRKTSWGDLHVLVGGGHNLWKTHEVCGLTLITTEHKNNHDNNILLLSRLLSILSKTYDHYANNVSHYLETFFNRTAANDCKYLWVPPIKITISILCPSNITQQGTGPAGIGKDVCIPEEVSTHADDSVARRVQAYVALQHSLVALVVFATCTRAFAIAGRRTRLWFTSLRHPLLLCTLFSHPLLTTVSKKHHNTNKRVNDVPKLECNTRQFIYIIYG